jgi:hypothetical protein
LPLTCGGLRSTLFITSLNQATETFVNGKKKELNMFSRLDVLGYFVPNTILSQIFCEFLSLEDMCRFDTAICNKKRRLLFLDCIGSESCICFGNIDRNLSSYTISWLHIRSIKIRHLRCKQITNDIAVKISSFGSCLHSLSIRDIYRNFDDQKLIQIVESCHNIERVKLIECEKITDEGILKIADECPHLNFLKLFLLHEITDVSLARVGDRCPNLHTLKLSYCFRITNISIIKVVEGCPDLHSLSLCCIHNISDMSIFKLAENCPNLLNLDLQWCDRITDTSIMSLSEGCPKLHLSLHNCTGIAMSKSKTMLRELNPNFKSSSERDYS